MTVVLMHVRAMRTPVMLPHFQWIVLFYHNCLSHLKTIAALRKQSPWNQGIAAAMPSYMQLTPLVDSHCQCTGAVLQDRSHIETPTLFNTRS